MTEARANETTQRPAFAHASEAELARILDYYQVRWEYESHTFPILWNLDGKVAESFAPDFYLPEFGLFVELTTLKQSLVRKKNRKLRRLRELYPEVRIKLFYARDFRALMIKYGKHGLLGELSGSVGQVTSPRTEEGASASAEQAAPPSGAPSVEVAPGPQAAKGELPGTGGSEAAVAGGARVARSSVSARRAVRRARPTAPVRPSRRGRTG